MCIYVCEGRSYPRQYHCCCCRPTPPCLFGGVLPYFEVTGNLVPVSSLGFKCPDGFIWNCNYIVNPSQMKGPFGDNCIRYFYLCWRDVTGCVEGIRRAVVLVLVLLAGTVIEQVPSVGPLHVSILQHPLASFSILQHPSASFSILHYPSSASFSLI